MLVGGNTVSYLENHLKDILGCYHVYTVSRNMEATEGSIADILGF